MIEVIGFIIGSLPTQSIGYGRRGKEARVHGLAARSTDAINAKFQLLVLKTIENVRRSAAPDDRPFSRSSSDQSEESGSHRQCHSDGSESVHATDLSAPYLRSAAENYVHAGDRSSPSRSTNSSVVRRSSRLRHEVAQNSVRNARIGSIRGRSFSPSRIIRNISDLGIRIPSRSNSLSDVAFVKKVRCFRRSFADRSRLFNLVRTTISRSSSRMYSDGKQY